MNVSRDDNTDHTHNTTHGDKTLIQQGLSSFRFFSRVHRNPPEDGRIRSFSLGNAVSIPAHIGSWDPPLSLKPFGDARYGIGNSLKWRCSRRTKVKPSHAIAIHLFSGVSLPNTLGFWTGSPSSDILLPKWGFAFTLYNAMIMMHIEFEFFCSYEPQKLFWAPLPL